MCLDRLPCVGALSSLKKANCTRRNVGHKTNVSNIAAHVSNLKVMPLTYIHRTRLGRAVVVL